VTGLDYGTSYNAVLGNAEVSSEGQSSSTTFTKIDMISFKTSDLSVNLQVTNLTNDAATVEASLTSDFEPGDGYYFYLVVYDSQSNIIKRKQLSEADLLKLKSAGGYTTTMKPDSELKPSYSDYGSRLTVALCYGKDTMLSKDLDTMKKEQKKYVMITNPFTSSTTN
jgi:hypothetical protein